MSNESQGCLNVGCGMVLAVLAFAVGCLVYGTLTGGLWTMLLWVATGFTSVVGLIPLAGPFLYWKLASESVMPSIIAAGGLYESWLTSVIFWVGLAGSVVWTITAIVLGFSFVAALTERTA
ncbi:MAG: hypothetical protein U0822_10115 [Anaerolineae bacterium]